MLSPQAVNPILGSRVPTTSQYLLSGQAAGDKNILVCTRWKMFGGTMGQPGSWWRERQCGGCLARQGVASSPRRVLRRAPDSPGAVSARGWGQIYMGSHKPQLWGLAKGSCLLAQLCARAGLHTFYPRLFI